MEVGGSNGRIAEIAALDATCVLEDLVNDTLNPHWQRHQYTSPASTVIQFGILVSGMLLNGFTFAVLIRIFSRRPFYLLLLNLVAIDFCTTISICFNVLVGSFGIHNIGNSDYVRCQLCRFSSFFAIVTAAWASFSRGTAFRKAGDDTIEASRRPRFVGSPSVIANSITPSSPTLSSSVATMG